MLVSVFKIPSTTYALTPTPNKKGRDENENRHIKINKNKQYSCETIPIQNTSFKTQDTNYLTSIKTT